MRFTYEGKQYSLSFQRKYQDVEVYVSGEKTTARSEYPFTTAILYERTGEKTSSTVAQATVGCHPGDPYSNEKGRLYALKALNEILNTRKFTKEFRQALWQSYQRRGNTPKVTVQNVPSDLPATVEGEIIH